MMSVRKGETKMSLKREYRKECFIPCKEINVVKKRQHK
jgi:hypothetical protein